MIFHDRLFTIMDSDSRGQLSKRVVKEFVTLRCPVFWRRDDDLRRFSQDPGDGCSSSPYPPATSSPTFDEVWKAVTTCSKSHLLEESASSGDVELGVEGWMVFCRFIALAQYLEAKRRYVSIISKRIV